ncbi:MAG: DNA repair protein RadC [Rikenellaceae bacterium]
MSRLQDKLMVRGVAVLSDSELLALLLDDIADCEMVAERLLTMGDGSLVRLASMDIARLRMTEGVGLRRAQRLVLAAEWGRRCSVAEGEVVVEIQSSSDVLSLVGERMRSLDHEEFWVLYLSSQNRVLEQQCIARGGVLSAVVDPRLIVKRALELLSTRIVVVHNHPSGGVEPSADDIEATRRLQSAASLFNIDILDHVIISSDGSEFSFLSSSLL